MTQSLPKVAAKIVFTGTKILGRAFAEAGRQAVRSTHLLRKVKRIRADDFRGS
jgi:hypothetical protein